MDNDDTASNPQADGHLPGSGEFDSQNDTSFDDGALNTAADEDDAEAGLDDEDLLDDEELSDEDDEDAPLSDETEPSDDAFDTDGDDTAQP